LVVYVYVLHGTMQWLQATGHLSDRGSVLRLGEELTTDECCTVIETRYTHHTPERINSIKHTRCGYEVPGMVLLQA